MSRRYWRSSFFFFFQAEDGIRDLTVTGVQTCALPISREPTRRGCRDAPARNLRAPGARWPRDRSGGERLAGGAARGAPRWPAGASLGRATHLRAARARRGAPVAAGELL